jgi:hypothetical protein
MVFNNEHRYAEVLYFFMVHKADSGSSPTFSLSDLHLLRESYGTLHVCKSSDEGGVVVIDAKTLTDVVGMVPFSQPLQEKGEGEFFLIEKMSIVTSTQLVEDDDV